jgi:CrcB protein
VAELRRSRPHAVPRLHVSLLAVVFAGGCVGGFVRYALTTGWTAPERSFPVATLVANLAGALILGAVLVVAGELRSSWYLRPLVGTGFCGALTTFSAVVVAAARLFSLGRPAVAVAYLCASILGGVFAAYLGVVTGRLLIGRRRPGEGSA